MRVCIHRGSKQIGGSCVEVESAGQRLIVDLGLPLDELGLITFNKVANWTKIKMDSDLKPEIIFLFANHNPRSSKLSTILNSPEIEGYDHSSNFDLKFYVSSFAGYALHADSMVTLSQFCNLL